MKNKFIEIQKVKIGVASINEKDYICISDIANGKNNKSRAADIIRNWLRNGSTLDFLMTWEELYNPIFKVFESEHFRKQVGMLTFVSSVKEFELSKDLENNYLIHINAIKKYILPNDNYYKNKEWLKYAEEADILNVIIFNTTAKKWRELNSSLAKASNIRDYASISELTVLSNIQSHNSELIKQGKSKEERFEILNDIAKYQLNVLNNPEKIRLLADKKMIQNN